MKETRENSYEFIELKYDDATPLFAAFEILRYTLLLLTSRERRDDFKYSNERNPWVKQRLALGSQPTIWNLCFQLLFHRLALIMSLRIPSRVCPAFPGS